MSNKTVRVFVPLTVRRRNGRPKILAPENALEAEIRGQDPHILKALGRAWAWRRRLETGEAATAGDIAKAERVTDRFVSRTMRLAYLSPEVLERLVIRREPPAISVLELIEATYLPWAGQMDRVLGDRQEPTSKGS
jgi:hypothetical protein